MSKKDIAHAKGRLAGIRESGWTCGDCGNFYDATVDHCPNRLLDEALVDLTRVKARHSTRAGAPKYTREQQPQFGYRAPERTADGKVIVVGPYGTREEAEAAADGLPIVELPPAPAEDSMAMGWGVSVTPNCWPASGRPPDSLTPVRAGGRSQRQALR